jgi:putative hemin transport protein
MSELRQEIVRMRHERPRLRARDLAAELGISEAELVADACGETAVRLRPDWTALMGSLASLGRVMALTRNDAAVIEKDGVYEGVSMSGHGGQVVGPEIDLRLFTGRWASAFAVDEPGGSSPERRRSLQIFDRHGMAVHKVHLRSWSDASAFTALVADLRAADQSRSEAVEPVLPAAPERADGEVDAAALRRDWDAMTDTHDFFHLLGRHKVSRIQAMRLAGERARQVPPSSLQRVLEEAASTGLSIMVFVSNPGCIQIHHGPISNIVPMPGWLNILDEGFNLHVVSQSIADTWVVVKPTRNGPVASLEVFDPSGACVLLLFAYRAEGASTVPAWDALLAALR